MNVRFLPLQPHCFAFGGFEIQMLSTLDAVRSVGTPAEKLDVWSKDKNFDILHVWGLDQSQYNTIYWAKRSGVKVVVTALLPYIDSIYKKMRNRVFSYLGNEKYMRKIAGMVDALVLVNDIQRQTAIDYFNAAPDRTFTIPNIVRPEFYLPGNGGFTRKYNIRDFVLIAGNVSKRKNQLKVVQACAEGNIPLVIIGHVMAGEEKLGDEIDRLIGSADNILWIKGVEPDSPDLINAFKDCSLLALPSYVEQQPISALEAAACQKPLLLADRSYARQKYYNNCFKVDPDSTDAIIEAIKNIRSAPERYIPDQDAISECRAESVGNHYKRVYSGTLKL